MNAVNLSACAEGLSSSLLLNQIKQIEDSVRAGGNAYLTVATQLGQVNQSISYLNKALQAADTAIVSLPMRWVVCLGPVVLGLLAKADIQNGTLRKAVLFFQDHVGNFCHVAALISSIALFYFGQIYLAAVSLASLTIGFLDRYQILPTAVRRFVHQCSPPLLIAASILSGDILSRIFSAINLASYGVGFYFSRKRRSEQVSHPTGALTLEKCREILTGKLPLRVKRSYLNYSTLPSAPNIDAKSVLMAQFNAIDWSANMGVLRAKLKNDQRYNLREGGPASKADDQLKQWVKKNFTALVDSIVEKKIREGEPVDYDKLHNYLKFIAQNLTANKNAVARTDYLLRLAVEGGEYCGPGKFEALENIYAEIVGENSEIPYALKMLNALQDERGRWMEATYAQMMGLHSKQVNQVGSAVHKVMDTQDLHIKNVSFNLWGDDLGLRKGGADNDEAAVIDPLIKLWVSYQYGNHFKNQFWQGHDVKSIVRCIQEKSGTSSLPNGEFYEMWAGWIERQKTLTDEQKEAMVEQLGEGKVYDTPLATGQSRILSRNAICAMLFDIGVLEVDPNPPKSLAAERSALLPGLWQRFVG